ncbi:hypothetical protein [Bacillus salipaludis]|uniref:Lipoprotein n=1 Tax=Bacillus salipaludis TaxID=2547811 RepID=A0AA90R2J2_9BACI|nr:hypothetical protein [Bacillus salipaludis]MDQ6599018.1 hypothetical protein [Bacillus salipaludis]
MKDLKKWVFGVLASFILVGAASGCSNNKDANTQQNQDGGAGDSQNSGSDQGTDQSGN